MICSKTSKLYILKQKYMLLTAMIIESLEITKIFGQFCFSIIIYLFAIYSLNTEPNLEDS